MKILFATFLLFFMATSSITQLSASSQINLRNSSQLLSCGSNKIISQSGICIQPKYIQGCILYSSQTQCAACNTGYMFTSDKCNYDESYSGSNSQIIGCLSYNQEKDCINCANGFYLYGSTCKKGVQHCASYDKLGTCTQCNVEYTLVLSQCRHNSLLGCKYQTDSHTCQECFAPFELVEQHCDIPNCQMINDYGCVACQCGFYITQNKDCKPVTKGCLRYQRTACTDCLPHFKLKGGVCEIQGCLQYTGQSCITCKTNYQNINGSCQFRNCYQWLNDSCIVCKQGYTLSGSVCIQIPQLSCS